MEQHAAETFKVLEVISNCQNTLMAKIDEVKIDISLMHQDMAQLKDRVTETEARISRTEDILYPLQHTTDIVQRQLQQISAKQDDMKNFLRRCSLRLVGLP